MKIFRPIILLFIYVIAFLSVSMLINLSNRIWTPMVRFQNPTFWIGIVPTAILLLGYTYLITWLYYRMVPVEQQMEHTSRKRFNGLPYFAISLLVVSCIQVLFLWYVSHLLDDSLGIVAYLQVDYIYFALPVLLYSYLVYHSVRWRMYRRPTIVWEEPIAATELAYLDEPQVIDCVREDPINYPAAAERRQVVVDLREGGGEGDQSKGEDDLIIVDRVNSGGIEHREKMNDTAEVDTDQAQRIETIIQLQQLLIRKMQYKSLLVLHELVFYDVFSIQSTTNMVYLTLTNGEKIVTPLTLKNLEQWPLWPWFVKTGRGVYTNMIHIRFPIKDSKVLLIEPKLRRYLLKKISKEELDKLLRVGRRLRTNVTSFGGEETPTLPHDGWDKQIGLK